MNLNFPLLLIFLISTVHAASSVQTDWSGGPGAPGPVVSWGSAFSSSQQMEFQKSQGSISLSWGTLTNASTEIEGSVLYFISVFPGDVDSDGDTDILVTSPLDNRVLWWENQNGAASWQAHQIASNVAGAFGADCADIDGDGDNDIVTAAMGDDTVIWWENANGTGSNWIEHTVDPALNGAKGIAVIDINNDGHMDIVASAKSADQIVWYCNNGSGTAWTKHIVADNFDCAMSVFPVDIDKDGDWDILSAAKLDGAVRWFENTDGSGNSWVEHSIAEGFYYARHAYASDFDGDGDMDILGAGGISKSSGVVCWWENTDGSCLNWSQHTIDSYFPGPFSILQFDVDQDGDMDAVSGSLTNSVICWWENQDSATNWEPHTLCNFSAPGIISAADLTGDGSIELFAGSLYSFNIHIWKSFGFRQTGSLISSVLDTGEDSQWNELQWSATVPAGTSLGVSMRSSWDVNDLGEWSDTVYTSPADLSSLINDNDRFVQYAVVMNSEACDTTPSLEQIEISWNPMSTGENPTLENELCCTGSNPSGSSIPVNCRLADAQTARLILYDLSGRAVFNTGMLPMNAGNNTFTVSNLSGGIYFARLNLAEGSISARFTVLN